MSKKLFGKSKASSNSKDTVAEVTVPPNSWICPKCGAINSNSSLSCKDCGTYK